MTWNFESTEGPYLRPTVEVQSQPSELENEKSLNGRLRRSNSNCKDTVSGISEEVHALSC